MLAVGVCLVTAGILGVLSHVFMPAGVDADSVLPSSLVLVIAGVVTVAVAILRY